MINLYAVKKGKRKGDELMFVLMFVLLMFSLSEEENRIVIRCLYR